MEHACPRECVGGHGGYRLLTGVIMGGKKGVKASQNIKSIVACPAGGLVKLTDGIYARAGRGLKSD